MATVKIVLDTRYKRGCGLFPIRVRVTHQKKQYYFNAKESMTKEHFQRVGPTEKATIFKEYIQGLVNRLYPFSIQELRKLVNLYSTAECLFENTSCSPLSDISGRFSILELPQEFVNPKPCIYFLLVNNIIQYIGQSINIIRRVVNHMSDKGKIFNRVFFIWCEVDRLDQVEQEMIKRYQPPLNTFHK